MNILIATDGSDSAKTALDFVIRFPFPAHSEATVVTVIDTKLLAGSGTAELDSEQSEVLEHTQQTIREDAEGLLADEAQRLQAAGQTVSTEIRTGNPAEQILKAAEELGPDLIVMGSHGLTGIKHFLLGSVADRVLEHADCSVLIVRASPTLSVPAEADPGTLPWKLLVAYDGSEPARKAVAFSAALPLGEQAEVSVISVMPMIHMYRQDIRQELNSIWQEKKHAAESALNNAVSAVRWSTPRVSTLFRESTDVAHEMLDVATRTGCDIMVLGHKGKSAVKRFLLGSIAGRIARHAPCSVLAVRARKDA
jgi:nucleotide-binding universal stress UspA family protein